MSDKQRVMMVTEAGTAIHEIIDETDGVITHDADQYIGLMDRLATAAIEAYEAARQPQPTDEELDRIFWKAHMSNLQGTTDTDPTNSPKFRGVRAVRAALTPVPQVQIPDGWHLVSIDSYYEAYPYAAFILEDDGMPDDAVMGTGPTWQEALAAACEKAGGEDESTRST